MAATLRAELVEHAGPGMEIRLDLVAGIPLESSGKRFVIRPAGGESPPALAPGSRDRRAGP
jgi:hypothetical protein